MSPPVRLTLFVCLALAGVASSQTSTEPDSRKLTKSFDADGNGRLDRAERDAARAWLVENPVRRRGRRRRPGPPRGVDGPPPNGGPPPGAEAEEATSGADVEVSRADAARHVGREIYDPSIVRTLFFDFESDDWEQELEAFYGTDVEVPAELTADGRSLGQVGMRFRGNSSFFTLRAGQKRSFNVSVDYVDDTQRLCGVKTLNLLNCHTDASFVREAVYLQICREFVPALDANHVQVVINGKLWGVYSNVQQFNSEFAKQRFGTKKGYRFKVSQGRSGRGALSDLGDDRAAYEAAYELKSKKKGAAWEALMKLCRVLNRTPLDQLEAELPAVLDVDSVLWYLALENVFMDGDGYFTRGSDYNLYGGRDGRFCLLPHDNNETFRAGGGGPGMMRGRRGPGGRRGRGRRGPSRPDLDPLEGTDDERRPLLSRVLAVPAWRARYLSHVNTLVEQWLDWSRIGPLFEQRQALIADAVAQDPRRLYSADAFDKSLAELREFVEQRRAFLLAHAALAKPQPSIAAVDHEVVRGPEGVRCDVSAKLGDGPAVAAILLHWSDDEGAPYRTLTMRDDGQGGDPKAGDGVYAASVRVSDGKARFYVEARAASGVGTTSFDPPRAESAPHVVDADPR